MKNEIETVVYKQGRFERSKRVIKREFNNISEFNTYLDEGKVNHKVFPPGRTLSSQDVGFSAKKFTGTSSYEEAVDLLTRGWEEGAKSLTTQLNIANSKMQPKEVKRAVYDIVGFQASVPRYIQGIPTSMVNKKTVKQKQKVVNIIKSVTYSAMITSKQILDDSVKFLQIVQAIESKGIRANVFVMFHTIVHGEELFIKVKIKSSSERLNISKMSFPLMHPSMLRRFFFKSLEIDSDITKDWDRRNYGRPSDHNESLKLVGKDEILVPILISEKQATELVSGVKQ